MRKVLKAYGILALLMGVACSTPGGGDLTGVQGRRPWFHPQPLGTIYVPTGSFHAGQSDQDIFRSYVAPNKQITVHSFWMDDTEITNNEYRQFVNYVKDSIARYLLDDPYVAEDDDGNRYIDYYEQIDWEESKEDLEEMYYRPDERFRNQRQIDVRKLIYYYQWQDLQMAASNPNLGRRDIIKEETVSIYPDTLCWIRDFTFSYNDPMTRVYFFHPKYDDYPVVGVNWKQARAFCNWRTRWLDMYWSKQGEPITEHWRLPTEYEWEYAARGGRENNPYPWGGPYTRNSKGCFMANFKPNRGHYVSDGGLYPVRADAYFPNDYGLYNMSGNVAEWTINAYAPASHQFTHDMNSDYRYDAREGDPITMKRKVIRGGSWKDIAHFIQTGSRSYEYQDSCKSFVGFRCVQTLIGRSALDKQ